VEFTFYLKQLIKQAKHTKQFSMHHMKNGDPDFCTGKGYMEEKGRLPEWRKQNKTSRKTKMARVIEKKDFHREKNLRDL
jgi:hypothetical protein